MKHPGEGRAFGFRPAGTSSANDAVTTREILQQLQHLPNQSDFAPYEAALSAAAEQRESIVPELIAAIDRVTNDPATYEAERGSCLHDFAFYLLAQFREPQALNAFVRFLSLPGDLSLDLTGDMITEDGAPLLASVCGGDPTPLLRLALNEEVNPFVREQAIRGVLVQEVWGERPREALQADLRSLSRNWLGRATVTFGLPWWAPFAI